MDTYLFIESLDPFDSADVPAYQDLAAALAREGNRVALFLVQNGVLAARAGARPGRLAELAGAGVEILADEFSLRERGIPVGRLGAGVKPAPLEVVIDHLVAGHKVLWH
jgi:sulfur relay (sulfurtransferase) complex TusBCD TusD component (DsrE family)